MPIKVRYMFVIGVYESTLVVAFIAPVDNKKLTYWKHKNRSIFRSLAESREMLIKRNYPKEMQEKKIPLCHKHTKFHGDRKRDLSESLG